MPCAADGRCPQGAFCGLASRTCVPAVVQVVAGAFHTCARHAEGTVTCWGLAESLRGGGAAVLAPAVVAAGQGARLLTAGEHQTCALTPAGGVTCWGNQSITVLREDGRPLDQVSALAVGKGVGCATSPAGVFCWGKNDVGQLARPMELSESGRAVLSLDRPVSALGLGVAVVALGGAADLCAWGSNATKMISPSDSDSLYRSPQCRELADVAELAVGDTHACVRRRDGSLVCWGERYYGALGIGGIETADVGPPGGPALVRGVRALAAGVSHTCVLGDRVASSASVDGGVGTDAPSDPPAGATAVICFGRNNFGQVGPDPGTNEEEVREPVSVPGLPDGTVLGLGSGSTAHHTCAIVAGGSLLCWGSNAAGQLGDGVTFRDPARFSAQPVPVRF